MKINIEEKTEIPSNPVQWENQLIELIGKLDEENKVLDKENYTIGLNLFKKLILPIDNDNFNSYKLLSKEGIEITNKNMKATNKLSKMGFQINQSIIDAIEIFKTNEIEINVYNIQNKDLIIKNIKDYGEDINTDQLQDKVFIEKLNEISIETISDANKNKLFQNIIDSISSFDRNDQIILLKKVDDLMLNIMDLKDETVEKFLNKEETSFSSFKNKFSLMIFKAENIKEISKDNIDALILNLDNEFSDETMLEFFLEDLRESKLNTIDLNKIYKSLIINLKTNEMLTSIVFKNSELLSIPKLSEENRMILKEKSPIKYLINGKTSFIDSISNKMKNLINSKNLIDADLNFDVLKNVFLKCTMEKKQMFLDKYAKTGEINSINLFLDKLNLETLGLVLEHQEVSRELKINCKKEMIYNVNLKELEVCIKQEIS